MIDVALQSRFPASHSLIFETSQVEKAARAMLKQKKY
jgi:hypothetical protein